MVRSKKHLVRFKFIFFPIFGFFEKKKKGCFLFQKIVSKRSKLLEPYNENILLKIKIIYKHMEINYPK